MRRRRLAAADEWRLSAEKMCEATKAKVPRLQSNSYADRMMARRNLEAIHKE